MESRKIGIDAGKIGVVADTHGLFDSRLNELFAGTELIIHAGDIGGEMVLRHLTAIAPVQAIYGNCDGEPLRTRLTSWRVADIYGARVLVLHDLGKPEKPTPEARDLMQRVRPRIVISGHTHQGRLIVKDDVLYVNPGAAGRKRFKLLRTIALLLFDNNRIEASLVSLESPQTEVVTRAAIPRLATQHQRIIPSVTPTTDERLNKPQSCGGSSGAGTRGGLRLRDARHDIRKYLSRRYDVG